MASAACPGPGPCPGLGDFCLRGCASGSGVASVAVAAVKVLPWESRSVVGMSLGAVFPPPGEGRDPPLVSRAAVPGGPSPVPALRAGHAESKGDEQHWSQACHLFCVPLEECAVCSGFTQHLVWPREGYFHDCGASCWTSSSHKEVTAEESRGRKQEL